MGPTRPVDPPFPAKRVPVSLKAYHGLTVLIGGALASMRGEMSRIVSQDAAGEWVSGGFSFTLTVNSRLAAIRN